MIDLTIGYPTDVDGVKKTQTERYCDNCKLICTVAINGRCAKTDTIVGRIAQKWDNKEQQTQLRGTAL